MGGIVKAVKKIVGKVAKVAGVVAPFLPPPFSTIATVVSGAAALSQSRQKDGRVSEDPQIAAAQRRQAASLAQQEAAIARERQQADDREAQLSGQAATQRNAIIARRRGRSSLAFSSSKSGLKSTFGG